MAVEPPPRLTYEDYLRFPDDGLRRELIDGEVHVTPSPNTRHQQIVGRLHFEIMQHLNQHGGGEVFGAPYDVVLSEVDVVQPDVVFVADADAGIITEANVRGVPTLVAEVVSDSTMDRRTKRDLYARAGLPEYWIVDPVADRVEVHRLREHAYGKPELFEPGEVLSTDLLPGLEIDLVTLLRR